MVVQGADSSTTAAHAVARAHAEANEVYEVESTAFELELIMNKRTRLIGIDSEKHK